MDKDSLENAYRLVESGDINTLEIETSKGLQEIHRYLFDSVYDDAGKLRKALFQKVESGFADALYLEQRRGIKQPA